MVDKHIIIIGAGFGGMTCAKKLGNKEGVRVTIVDRKNHHLFQPLLYQVATSTLAAPDISRSIRSIFDKYNNIDVVYDHIERVDLAGKVLHASSGLSLSYDYLVVATGVKTSFFGKAEWEKHVYCLKSLDDAFSIREKLLRSLEVADRGTEPQNIAKLSTTVIIGGGPTGVELAGAFSDLVKRTMKRGFKNYDTSQQRIILIEAQDQLLGAFPRDQAEYAVERLEQRGVEVKLNSMVSHIDEGIVELKSGEIIEAGVIIWGAGVEATPITKTLGVSLNRAGLVEVEKDLSIPGNPEAFVIGDAAAVKQANGKLVPGQAPAAMQEGGFVATIIKNELVSGIGKRPDFDYFDKGFMAIVGKNSAVVNFRDVLKVKGFLAWMMWLFIHIMFLTNFRSRIGVLISWCFSYLADKPGARVVTAASDDEWKA
ncbi:NAD(P)/FAD-dependent oxidoreductase [Persicirhabdus sediminis]|uniref:NAD(P)/FAD-dependent oxidoreductase n=1 Tax=Persicirhabdus sediminis TaxID=454144 RepID=A0A8J7MF04_9BACT|nr:NAD(P)/FAD-dependent oxidoreductase [Persicirhabdus sediminis]MBK1791468.1 NAD(P)/FAD-dependent oxidoreductase [Persicirhabdus sediminis]